MEPQDIEALFRRDGAYVFARWGRPICPVIFGVDDASLAMMKGGIEAIVAHAGHQMAETDPELGVNMMVFFCQDWNELEQVDDLDALIPEMHSLIPRLHDAQAHQYRLFRYDEDGAIKACFTFLRMADGFEDVPLQVLALDNAARSILAWGDRAFAQEPPMMAGPEGAMLRIDVADVIRAAYDPILPAAAQDASHALRLFARMSQP